MRTQLRPGDYIAGEYRILKVFGGEGQSGMGVVYLVENRSFYERFVLKTYQSSGLGDKKARFRKEAETWVHLGSHPNIVRCLWVNEIEDALYVAAEYVAPDEDGFNTLEDRLSAGRIPLDKQIRWSAEFCFAMRHAYRKGLVSHRDLKPANLMLADGTLKVTDFGLSKLQGHVDTAELSHGGGDGSMTMDGVAIGTWPYMAPEQFRDFATADQRADIHSFGVILYAMATAELPIYPDRPPKNQDELAVLWAVAHHRAAVRRAKFPLFPVVARCLEKNPANRFQSFDEILAAIGKVAEANKLHLPKEQVTEAEFDDAYALAMSFTALGKPDDAMRKLAEITSRWPSVPQPFNEMGKILLAQGKTSEAIPWFKRAVELDETRSPPWNNLGAAHARLGQLEPAEFAYSCAIKADSENTGAMIGLAQLLMQKNAALALNWCERAYELRPEKLNVLRIGGEAALRAGKTDRATDFFSEALKVDPSDQRTFFNLALTYRARKMLKEHADLLKKYLERWPNDREAYQLLSQAYVDMGQIETATDVCLRWSKVEGAEVSGTINLAHLWAAQGKNLNGYMLLNKALEHFPSHAGLWLCMAHVLKDLPDCRQQARTAAENAMACLSEPAQQPPRVAAADIEQILRALT
jgi:serine/threonine protein kinase/thioredoxin-like negative regulator of GroEL